MSKPVSQAGNEVLAELLKHAKPATSEELKAQGESLAKNYKHGLERCSDCPRLYDTPDKLCCDDCPPLQPISPAKEEQSYAEFSRHLSDTAKEVANWPSVIRDASRSAMGLPIRPAKEEQSEAQPVSRKREEVITGPRCKGCLHFENEHNDGYAGCTIREGDGSQCICAEFRDPRADAFERLFQKQEGMYVRRWNTGEEPEVEAQREDELLPAPSELGIRETAELPNPAAGSAETVSQREDEPCGVCAGRGRITGKSGEGWRECPECCGFGKVSKPSASVQVERPELPTVKEFRERPQTELDAATERICIGGRDAAKAFFERHPDLGFAIALDTQCELNERCAQLLKALSRISQLEQERGGLQTQVNNAIDLIGMAEVERMFAIQRAEKAEAERDTLQAKVEELENIRHATYPRWIALTDRKPARNAWVTVKDAMDHTDEAHEWRDEYEAEYNLTHWLEESAPEMAAAGGKDADLRSRILALAEGYGTPLAVAIREVVEKRFGMKGKGE